ncbi:dihydroneopterin triphosphate diphosphatase [Neisseria iguanae]|uniref:Dihydroneopterin triphosphate diphosphatase n=1 Tax=Neisseria iguanae TaxID=90242 RepID=A0A2P7U1D4_9NEIS|nr:dihydroneopterin triphosphate diphosphatase [Neisseria iguanae]PSJ80745.1 dihydroneopterin triphosphate diphosphatase [Neisseria iguanae]
MVKPLKRPVSALVVLHDGCGNILLIQRADRQNFWQSVTGSVEDGEIPFETAVREVWEETGIRLSDGQLDDWQHSSVYEIYPHWRYRYPPGVTHNIEHVFSAIIPRNSTIRLQPEEHSAYQWLPIADAAEKVFSPSNREAILRLGKHLNQKD